MIFSELSGMITDVKLVQALKAQSPIIVTLLEIETLTAPEQLEKAHSPIAVIPSSMVSLEIFARSPLQGVSLYQLPSPVAICG